jgi:hypothetical protein
MGRDEAEGVRSANLDEMRHKNIRSVKTNAIFATARKVAQRGIPGCLAPEPDFRE